MCRDTEHGAKSFSFTAKDAKAGTIPTCVFSPLGLKRILLASDGGTIFEGWAPPLGADDVSQTGDVTFASEIAVFNRLFELCAKIDGHLRTMDCRTTKATREVWVPLTMEYAGLFYALYGTNTCKNINLLASIPRELKEAEARGTTLRGAGGSVEACEKKHDEHKVTITCAAIPRSAFINFA